MNTDVCGTMTETSVGGAGYYFCFKVDYSKYRHVFFITTKSEVADCLQKFLKEVKTAGHVTKVWLSELLSAFANKTLILYIENTTAIKLTKNPDRYKRSWRCDISM
jgi:hypothetical protein